MIIEYNSRYNDSVKELLYELQEYIMNLDQEKYNTISQEYKEEYFNKVIEMTVLVNRISKIKTKTNTDMAFITYGELIQTLSSDLVQKPELIEVEEFDDNELIKKELDLY